MNNKRIRVIEAEGSPYEIGFQYGKACPEISQILDITYQLFGGKEQAKATAQKYLPMYLPPAQQYAPEIIDEMKGIAAGANLDFQDIFFFNITYEISVTAEMGCTSFAAGGGATVDGQVIAGQNFDFLSQWQDLIVLLKIKPSGGPNILAVTPAGGLGLIGLNSAGISLNLNLLRNRESLTPKGGVPAHIILRKVLASENLGEAIGTIASAKGRAAKNYLLASDQGDIIDVEVTSDDLDIHYPVKGMLTHANYFKTERFKSTDLAPALWPDSYVRSQRLLQLMEDHHGQLSIDRMKVLLQDHNNFPNSICRHPDPRNPLPAGRMIKTLASLIASPREHKILLGLGNPCENEFVEYRL